MKCAAVRSSSLPCDVRGRTLAQTFAPTTTCLIRIKYHTVPTNVNAPPDALGSTSGSSIDKTANRLWSRSAGGATAARSGDRRDVAARSGAAVDASGTLVKSVRRGHDAFRTHTLRTVDRDGPSGSHRRGDNRRVPRAATAPGTPAAGRARQVVVTPGESVRPDGKF